MPSATRRRAGSKRKSTIATRYCGCVSGTRTGHGSGNRRRRTDRPLRSARNVRARHTNRRTVECLEWNGNGIGNGDRVEDTRLDRIRNSVGTHLLVAQASAPGVTSGVLPLLEPELSTRTPMLGGLGSPFVPAKASGTPKMEAVQKPLTSCHAHPLHLNCYARNA